jgi:N-acetyltransferase
MAKDVTRTSPVGASRSLSPVPPSPHDIDWRQSLPTLSSDSVTVREPTAADALPLLAALASDALAEVVSDPPPATQDGFASLFASQAAKRAQGLEACWVIVPRDTGAPIGLIRVRALDHGFAMVEGSAAIAEEFQGTHVFQEAARLVLGCLFRRMHVHRAEFRVDVRNPRAHGALRKLGAAQEGLLRRARHRAGVFSDEVLWAIVAGDWGQPRDAADPRVH